MFNVKTRDWFDRGKITIFNIKSGITGCFMFMLACTLYL